VRLRLGSVVAVLTGAATLTGVALSAQPVAATPSQNPQSQNPYLPSSGHSYRHGAATTRAQQDLIQGWNNSHASAAPAAAMAGTSANTMAFYGGINGGQGATTGTPRIYLVFWGSQWGTAGTDANGNLTLSGDADGGAPYIQQTFKGLGTNGELWSGTMTQYCDGPSVANGATSCPTGAPHVGYPTGGALAGVWYDNSAAEPGAATSSQIGAEAVSAASHFGNTTSATNRYVQYDVLSAPGLNPDTYLNSGFCAWHSFESSSYGDLAFTNMPYVMDRGGSCGAGSVNNPGTLDGYSIVNGHEYAETVTDQYPDYGWQNATTAGDENGDECAWIGSGQGAMANVAMATGAFPMQSTWSNDTNRCDISHPIVTSGASNTVTVTNPGNETGTVGTATSLQITATDSATGTTLTYTATGLPAGLAINASSGLISGTPTTAATNNVTVKATDNTGAAGTASFTWTISGVTGHTVTVTNPGNRTGTVGTATSLQITATDSATGTTLTYTATGLPAGLTINASSGLISGTPTTAATNNVTVKATDNTGATGTASFTWTINSAAGPCSGQLLRNPGFESGSTGWTATSGVISTDGAYSHTGAGYAWLDGYNQAWTDTVAQTVTIKAGCKATLSYWLWIDSSQTGTAVHDTLQVTVNGVVVQSFSNLNKGSGYVLRSVNLSAYAGKTVTIKWWGKQTTTTPTSFLLDDTGLTLG
jgi:hypothetical protein